MPTQGVYRFRLESQGTTTSLIVQVDVGSANGGSTSVTSRTSFDGKEAVTTDSWTVRDVATVETTTRAAGEIITRETCSPGIVHLAFPLRKGTTWTGHGSCAGNTATGTFRKDTTSGGRITELSAVTAADKTYRAAAITTTSRSVDPDDGTITSITATEWLDLATLIPVRTVTDTSVTPRQGQAQHSHSVLTRL